jgi:hypothetical protein
VPIVQPSDSAGGVKNSNAKRALQKKRRISPGRKSNAERSAEWAVIQRTEDQAWAAFVRSERPPQTIEQLADDLVRQVAEVIGDFPGGLPLMTCGPHWIVCSDLRRARGWMMYPPRKRRAGT